MKRFLKIIKTITLFLLLTILTQVGGLIYLIYKPLSGFIGQRYRKGVQRFTMKIIAFSLLFCGFSFLIIPPIAKQFGRVALPIYATKDVPIKPATILTCIANRHYVKPQLLVILKTVAEENRDRELIYLDANFPFISGFPLLPHKSHDDGEKIDIAFNYLNGNTKKSVNKTPTLFGYGYCEAPKKGEYSQPKVCVKKGYWQYSLLEKITRQNKNYVFDAKATKKLLLKFIKQPKIKKIFIEPHLKQRLNLQKENKIRFHGCGAVRHDDHIHLQL